MTKTNVDLLKGALIVCLFGCASLNAAIQLNVAYDQEFQVIDGFGASDAWSMNPTINKWQSEGKQADIELLADRLFSVEQGIGLSAWRFNVGAGSAEQGDDSGIPDHFRRAELLIETPGSPIDVSKQLGQIRMLREAHARGVSKFVVFANSPPHWATKNGLTHPGDGKGIGSTNLDPDRVSDFARFLTAVLVYLRSDAVGVPVNYVSPINEPTWDWQGQTQEANRYNMTELKTVYASLYAALQAADLHTLVEVDGAEVVEYAAALSDAYKIQFDGKRFDGGMNGKGHGSFKGYIDALLGDARMRQILNNKISLHGYWSEASAERLGGLRDLVLKNIKSVSADATVWMSEFCVLGDPGDVRTFGGPGFEVADMDYALHIARVIHRDLTRLNVSAWFWWLALTPYDYKDGLLKIDPSLEASTVQESKLLWTLGNFSRFIRPGYRRVDLPGVDDLKGVMASSYKDAAESTLVVVAINAGTRPAPIRLNVGGLPAGKQIRAFAAYATHAEQDLEQIESLLPGHSYTLPPRSTLTFVARLVAVEDDGTRH